MLKQIDARQRCYDEIVLSVKDGLARYYGEFPDRIGDERAADALAWSLRGIQRIHCILDQYEITEKTARSERKGEGMKVNGAQPEDKPVPVTLPKKVKK